MQATIVLAEDSKTVRRMVEIALARHPFQLSVAEDGEAALGAVRSARPALVLADTSLPGIDGYELTRRIKAEIGGVKVLLLAGLNQRLDELRARQVGADGHVTKPFATQDLLDAIYQVTTGQLAPDGELFRNQGPKVPLARKPQPPKPPEAPAAERIPVAPAAPSPAIVAAPVAPAAAAQSIASAQAPSAFDAAEATRPFQRPEAPAPRAPAAEPAGPVSVGEDALREAVAAVAKDVIERIVWEVVPSLAEALLKEEIARVVRERLAQD